MNLFNKFIISGVAVSASMCLFNTIQKRTVEFGNNLQQAETYEDAKKAFDKYADNLEDARDYYYSEINYKGDKGE